MNYFAAQQGAANWPLPEALPTASVASSAAEADGLNNFAIHPPQNNNNHHQYSSSTAAAATASAPVCPSGGFEGPEKRLEVLFRVTDNRNDRRLVSSAGESSSVDGLNDDEVVSDAPGSPVLQSRTSSSSSLSSPNDSADYTAAPTTDSSMLLSSPPGSPRGEFSSSSSFSAGMGLRSLAREQWQLMLNLVNCTILVTKNDFFDSYVLSESSLFVYPTKIILKTCGTTTLLKCLPKLLEYANCCNLTVEFVRFSRKNYVFPHKQVYPHNSWAFEVDYLNSIFDGAAYIIGPLTQPHWYLYLADYRESSSSAQARTTTGCSGAIARRGPMNIHNSHDSPRTIEIMMHQLDREAMNRFYKKEGTLPNQKFPGISDLIPGSITDEFNFEPCGYSMNGLNGDSYYTIHVTPEPNCSFVSFETNFQENSYANLIQRVFSIFKPGSVTVTFFCAKGQLPEDLAGPPGYNLKHKTSSELEGDKEVLLCNYELRGLATDGFAAKKKVAPQFVRNHI